MILTILGLAFVIIGTFFVYKNSQDYGRNAPLWAVITFLVGIGIQWFFPAFIVIIWLVLLLLTGSDQIQAQTTVLSYSFLLTIGGLLFSAVVVLWILRFVSQMPSEKETVSPPSPPKFD
jgi:hypothetical protein